MKNIKHPAFIIGVVSIILVIIGAAIWGGAYKAGWYFILAGIVLGAIHWIWSIIDVIGRNDMKPFQKRFWLIVVVAVPALGGLVFYVMHQKKDRLTT